MSNPDIIENKIAAVKRYLRKLQKFEKHSQENIEKDFLIRGALERYLYLTVQATIDLGDAFIAYKKFPKPTSLKETFHILHEEEIIDYELTDKMVKMTGFRNIIAHDYEKIDYSIVCDILQNRLKDIEEFIEIISEKI